MRPERIRGLMVLNQQFLKSLQSGNNLSNEALIRAANDQQKIVLLQILRNIVLKKIPLQNKDAKKVIKKAYLLSEIRDVNKFDSFISDPQSASNFLALLSGMYPYLLSPLFHRIPL